MGWPPSGAERRYGTVLYCTVLYVCQDDGGTGEVEVKFINI